MHSPKRWRSNPLLFVLLSLVILLFRSTNNARTSHLIKRATDARLHELLTAGRVVTGAINTSGQTSSSGADGDFTCGPGRPCSNGACCGASGWCGYEPKYCGKGCQSNCSAKAECGQYADPPGKGCPLNVCCSAFGFCGMASEFCGAGCQSHCTQPKPHGPKSNAQQVVIGYYEGWSFNHSCGTMTPAEIPINKLTHLIFSFAYISPGPAFKIITMDGLSPNLFSQVVALKDRNPNLKVLVALGGWTYTDPGKYQPVFSNMVASAATRAAFIRNLLGFLSEYGFDGVDFDWEYPGAKDRGGKPSDGANYAKLFKELRAAVNRDSHGYLVTVTAPTSYWYLRHFDLPATAPHVSWINLMSYDLHGVWDNDNPIGNRVLGHTNLTEIDLALDLFWRNDIEPRKVVLGLGFYGRSFQLKDSNCWKPGCRFGGPGDKGECTDTPGILSYHEVRNILTRTKASPHYDAAAAVNYLVYGDGSWVSYDDKRTFQKKVDFASSMGLGGLMVWAVDLDNTARDALKAISPINADVYCCDPPGGLDRPFTAVDLDRLFPKKYLPPASAIPDYTLTSFGGATEKGLEEPNGAGVAFFLVAGSSIAAASMRTKRAGGQMGLVFLDCPGDVLFRPNEQAQTARIICMEEDVNACFGVREGGVEGTVVEMPEHCGGRSFSRAISLNFSMDQNIPDHIAKRDPTSAVFDFTFDYNMKLLRRDAGPLSIRIDYSNVPGYENKKRGVTGLEERFFSPKPIDWASRINKLAHKNGKKMTASLDNYYFDGTVNECPSGPETRTDEIAIGSEGSVSADTWYGFSAVANIEGGTFSVHQASGFFLADGSTEAKFKAGGLGKLDTSAALQGRSMSHEFGPKSQGGHHVDLHKFKGWVEFDPYIDVGIKMTTSNKTSPTGQGFSFEGYMEGGVKSQFYGGHVTFPNPDDGDDARRPDDATNKGVDHKNVLVPLGFKGTGKLAVTSIVEMGLSVTINMPVKGGEVLPEVMFARPHSVH
ncbi:glycoside hydrolase family 18 protein [Aplosporella prunicola CBS 121167]|uniref:chitinase n=1 Tax=Aplosporella prunicola CBS 121167 TaxID=1176127 RepID=A0A6A6B2Z4_9PEZI|nr:glycoside hydrolase family 18 protein [Aplosporella prunicola CBS 121167]KAF2137101.1 glycoside hydrolase family 18 protein [Aplosporella prunicola CBS 121167]